MTKRSKSIGRGTVLVTALMFGGCENDIPEDLIHCERILSVPDEFPTIQAAIDQAEMDDCIVLQPGTYRGRRNVGLEFRHASITIQSTEGAKSTVIDLEKNGRFFALGEDQADILLTVKGLTIQNGRGDQGGAIYAGDPYLLSLVDCVFVNNEADQGGAVFVGFIEDVPVREHPLMIGCRLEGNSSINGGALFTQWAKIQDSQFSHNVAFQNGGAIFGEVDVKHCEFLANTAGRDSIGFGGAVYSPHQEIGATDCTFEGNMATEGGAVSSPGVYESCTFVANEAQVRGGALVDVDEGLSRLIILDSRFVSNRVTSDSLGWGGAVCERNGRIEHCSFEANSAREGGALYGIDYQDVRACSFSGNTAKDYGGAVAFRMGSERWVGWLQGSTISGNIAGLAGGGVDFRGSDYALAECRVTLNSVNQSGGRGGGVYFESSGDPYDDGNLRSCAITHNRAEGPGGGLYFVLHEERNRKVPYVYNCTFDQNQSSEIGGHVYVEKNHLEILNSILWGGSPDLIGLDSMGPATVSVNYSIVQGGWNGAWNITFDPLFSDEEQHLSAASPARDRGKSDLDLFSYLSTDVDGDDRYYGASVDIGADEYSEK